MNRNDEQPTSAQPATATPPPMLNRTLLLSIGGGALLLILMLMLLRPEPAAPQITIQPSPDGPAVIAPESHMLGQQVPQIGEPAPDFSFTMPDGSEMKLSDYRGQKVIINFWASWCAPCKAEMPDIQRVYDAHREDGLVVLAVNREEDLATIQQFVAEVGISFPVVANMDGDISQQYGALGLPTTFFINTDGTVSSFRKGIMDEAFILEQLDQLR